MNLNEHYLRLSDTDPASLIEKKIQEHMLLSPDRQLLRLDAEDSPFPLPRCVDQAMSEAAIQLQNDATLRKLPPVSGYPFLIEAIKNSYSQRSIALTEGEIFINNGAKCDIAGILELASTDNTVVITEPFNPVYYSSNLAAGRNVRFISSDPVSYEPPLPDEEHADIIYLSSPCNPTGYVYTKEMLKQWVDYALYHNALILFDASYEAFIRSEELPRSIYEIEGAKKCAVEICSLSKAAGFGNTRLGYTVIPNPLIFDSVRLNQLWMRRERMKFNGVSYVAQKGAAAVFSEEGQKELCQITDAVLLNAQMLRRAFVNLGLCQKGEVNSPFVWIRCPQKLSSWGCFDYFLKEMGVVTLPGSIFGAGGENHMKISAYATREIVCAAIERFAALMGKEKPLE